MDEASDVIPAAMLDAGLDPVRMDPADIRAAVEHIRPVRKHIRSFNTAPIEQMAKGSPCVAMDVLRRCPHRCAARAARRRRDQAAVRSRPWAR